MKDTVIHSFLLAQRERINVLDARLVELLAERFAVTREIGIYKADLDLPSRDMAREQAHDKHVRRLAGAAGIAPNLASEILRLILDESVRDHDSHRASRRGNS